MVCLSRSEIANDIELVVVLVLPERGVAEVGIIEELATTLSPADRLSLRVPVDDCRVCRDIEMG